MVSYLTFCKRLMWVVEKGGKLERNFNFEQDNKNKIKNKNVWVSERVRGDYYYFDILSCKNVISSTSFLDYFNLNRIFLTLK